MIQRFLPHADEIDRLACLPWHLRRGVNVILTCINSNMPCTLKCIYDLPSYAERWLHPRYTSGAFPLSRLFAGMVNLHMPVLDKEAGCAYSIPDPGTLNNPVFLTVAMVMLWHVMGGIYL
jgi:hypothetical protein